MATVTKSVEGQLKVIRDLIYHGLKQAVEHPEQHQARADQWVQMMDEYRFLIHLLRNG